MDKILIDGEQRRQLHDALIISLETLQTVVPEADKLRPDTLRRTVMSVIQERIRAIENGIAIIQP